MAEFLLPNGARIAQLIDAPAPARPLVPSVGRFAKKFRTVGIIQASRIRFVIHVFSICFSVFPPFHFTKNIYPHL